MKSSVKHSDVNKSNIMYIMFFLFILLIKFNINHLNKKYEIVVAIKAITTQTERLARNCFSLEFDCKKLGSINIKTPVK